MKGILFNLLEGFISARFGDEASDVGLAPSFAHPRCARPGASASVAA